MGSSLYNVFELSMKYSQPLIIIILVIKIIVIIEIIIVMVTLQGKSLKTLHEGIRGGGGGGQSDSSRLLLTPFIRLARCIWHILN